MILKADYPRACAFIIGLFFMVALLAPTVSASSASLKGELKTVEKSLKGAVDLAKKGNHEEAAGKVYRAFMDFESSKLHGLLASKHPSVYGKLETKYLSLRAASKRGNYRKVDSHWSSIQSLHEEVRSRLSSRKDSFWSLFVSSFAIIFREGLEALLILVMLGAYLVKIKAGDQKYTLYVGSAAAILASILLAVGARYVFSFSVTHQELLEGITMLIATGVLFYVAYWLLARIEVNRWKRMVRQKVKSSVETGSTFFLATTAFVVVFREGFETVLFYQALAFSSDTMLLGAGSILSGFLVGLVGLAIVGYLIIWTSLKIPLRPFFGVTSAFLYFLAFKFAGDGMMELQEAGYMPGVTAPFVPDLSWLQTFFGIYPSWPSLYLQLLLILALMVGVIYTFRRQLQANLTRFSRKVL